MTIRYAALIAAMAGLLPAGAEAASELTVYADQAAVVNLTGEASTVVVGNPSIADATVRGNALFVHGRTFGHTNVIALDADGNELASISVNVMLGGAHNINVFRKGAKFSYACNPHCESTLQIGDNGAYFEIIGKETESKIGISTGAVKADK